MNESLKQIKNNLVSWDRQHGYNLDTEQINWLIETVEEQQKEIEGLRIAMEAERGFINNFYQNRSE